MLENLKWKLERLLSEAKIKRRYRKEYYEGEIIIERNENISLEKTKKLLEKVRHITWFVIDDAQEMYLSGLTGGKRRHYRAKRKIEKIVKREPNLRIYWEGIESYRFG